MEYTYADSLREYREAESRVKPARAEMREVATRPLSMYEMLALRNVREAMRKPIEMPRYTSHLMVSGT